MSHTGVSPNAFGGPDELNPETVTRLPKPGAGEVRNRLLVTRAIFTDVSIPKGVDPHVTEVPPFAPGYDMVGVVDAVGPGAARFRLGDRVADLTTVGTLDGQHLTARGPVDARPCGCV
ncbi:MAG: alcohol dehydrogenase catalytic domain-containing protein [Gemmobacter sp.]|nr:alcohol dehydrogenase catalytic domain-containing protein [Gemmobacter sp.]